MARWRLALIAAVTVVVVLVAGVALLVGGDDPDVRLTAAGPADGGQVAAAPTTTTTEDRLRVEAGHDRTSPPQPTTTDARADNPVVRTSTTVKSGNAASPVAPPPAVTPPAAPGGAACPASEVRVAVVTAPSYAPGTTVRGETTIENRSAAACLLPTRGFVRILNAAGKDVSAFAYTMEYRFPVSAGPGKTFSTPFTWDQKDCSGAACVQVPAGVYTVVADWTEGGPYSGRASFTVGG